MGSLMAGWGSPKSGKFERNRSLTKEDIDGFWKIKKKTEEEHLKAISTPAPDKTRPVTGEEGLDDSDFANKTGWWTRSNWAFLNEPPVMERAPNTYVSQFHIAKVKINPDIGAA